MFTVWFENLANIVKDDTTFRATINVSNNIALNKIYFQPFADLRV